MTIPVFAADRMDAWIFKVAIAVPLVCICGLVLWHLMSRLSARTGKNRRSVRQSPEPEPTFLHSGETAGFKNDPERLQRACAGLVESLAETYLQLADCWLRQGQREQAVIALREIVQRCPETRQAQTARERLQRLQGT
jgi:hypothetical protein